MAALGSGRGWNEDKEWTWRNKMVVVERTSEEGRLRWCWEGTERLFFFLTAAEGRIQLKTIRRHLASGVPDGLVADSFKMVSFVNILVLICCGCEYSADAFCEHFLAEAAYHTEVFQHNLWEEGNVHEDSVLLFEKLGREDRMRNWKLCSLFSFWNMRVHLYYANYFLLVFYYYYYFFTTYLTCVSRLLFFIMWFALEIMSHRKREQSHRET